jgi:hypothetical protein
METMLVRLKAYDPRRGYVLRRFTYKGIKFHEEHGWYRVEKSVAEYLSQVTEPPSLPGAPLAFDVCTESEAQALEVKEKEASTARKVASDDIKLSVARPVERVQTTEAGEPARPDKPKKERG